MHEPRPWIVVKKKACGQTDVHVPAPASKTAPSTHEVQEVELAAEQVAHEASQSMQVAFSSANVPAGQLLTQEPSVKYFVPDAGQLRHEDEVAPLHVSQDA